MRKKGISWTSLNLLNPLCANLQYALITSTSKIVAISSVYSSLLLRKGHARGVKSSKIPHLCNKSPGHGSTDSRIHIRSGIRPRHSSRSRAHHSRSNILRRRSRHLERNNSTKRPSCVCYRLVSSKSTHTLTRTSHTICDLHKTHVLKPSNCSVTRRTRRNSDIEREGFIHIRGAL